MSTVKEARRLARRASDVRARWGGRALAIRGADKVFVYATFPMHQRRWGPKSFRFDGENLPYFIHHYNATWRSERMVEISIAERFLRQHPGRGLEIGNVLAYYRPVAHTVVDKYEQGEGVLNEDVVDFNPEERFDYIVAISTLEHVGWDEDPRQPDKIAQAIEHLRGLLSPDGVLLVTCPRGYNSWLDAAIMAGSLKPSRQWFLRRSGERGPWLERDADVARSTVPFYDLKHRNACDLWIAEFDSR